jgi:hypothetical protein
MKCLLISHKGYQFSERVEVEGGNEDNYPVPINISSMNSCVYGRHIGLGIRNRGMEFTNETDDCEHICGEEEEHLTETRKLSI